MIIVTKSPDGLHEATFYTTKLDKNILLSEQVANANRWVQDNEGDPNFQATRMRRERLAWSVEIFSAVADEHLKPQFTNANITRDTYIRLDYPKHRRH